LSRFEGKVYVVFLKKFGGDGRVNLRVNFLKFAKDLTGVTN